MAQPLQWYKIYFKGGDADRPHEETMGVQATSVDHAREVALAKMRDDFDIQYPQVNDVFLMPGQPSL